MNSSDFKLTASEATQQFAVNWRIATQSIANLEEPGINLFYVWGNWAHLKDFPQASKSAADRYFFIDRYLCDLLQAESHHLRQGTFVRPDLNGRNGSQRAWLMHKVLTQVMKKNDKGHNTFRILTSGLIDRTYDYQFPEDLPKVVEDMNALRKYHAQLPRGPERTLQHYKNVENLAKAMARFQDPRWISRTEREKANDQFLKPDGKGDAVLVATLPDGSEIIHVKSEAASLAYGSPRWCTAYRNRPTYFHEYQDDLLIMIDEKGDRWQFHFRIQQFHDKDDNPIEDLAEFVNKRRGLGRALVPFVLAASGPPFPPSKTPLIEKNWAKEVPEWRDGLVSKNGLPKIMNEDFEKDFGSHIPYILIIASGVPLWRLSLAKPPILFDILCQMVEKTDENLDSVSHAILDTIEGVPEWVDVLAQPDGIPALFEYAARSNAVKAAQIMMRHVSHVEKWGLALERELHKPEIAIAIAWCEKLPGPLGRRGSFPNNLI